MLIQPVYERQRDTLCLTHEHASIVDCIAERGRTIPSRYSRGTSIILAALDLTENHRAQADIYDVG